MTSFTDFTDVGFFPLQDHAAAQDGTPVSRRMMLAAGRIVEMTDPGDVENAEQSQIKYGREHGLGTLGDVHPWMFWQTRERAVRGMGSWAQAFATLAVNADPFYGTVDAQPLRDYRFINDTRYRPLDASWPVGFQRVPRGALLTVMPGTDEAAQHSVAMWADPRLIAPNAGGPGECGTLVADLGPEREICMDGSDRPGIGGRHARLQSLLRVIAVTPGSSFAALGGEGNTLALNFSTSGKDSIPNFGAFYAQTAGGAGGPATGGPTSNPTTGSGSNTPPGPITGQLVGEDAPAASTFGTLQVGGGAFGESVAAGEDEKQPKDFGQFANAQDGGHAVALMSAVGGFGPLHPGGQQDKHNHGRDRDGHPINAAHISTGAYFYGDETRDAPLEFAGNYPSPDQLPEVARVFLTYDPVSAHNFRGGSRPGLWRWYAESPDVTPPPTTPPTTPPTGPPTQTPPTGQPPGTPTTTPPTTPPTTTPPTGGPPRQPGDVVPPTGAPPTRPTTPNPGQKRFPNRPGTGPTTGPTTGTPSGGTPAGPTTGGSGGQPSVPCKVPPITGAPLAGPITGGPGQPSSQVPPGPGAQPVWTGGGRGGGGGGGSVPPGGPELRSNRQTVMPTGAAQTNSGGSIILPASAHPVGRSSGGTPGQDVREHLGRLAGRDPVTNLPSTVEGVSERIGSPTREDGPLYTLFRPMAQGFASINFRPQLTVNGYPNFEHNPQMPRSMYRLDEAERPQVLTMRAYGAQSTGDGEWSYKQRPAQSRARGGTGDGGILLAPPRFELSDYYGVGGDVMDVTDTTSAQATTHYVLHAPGVSTAYGLPNASGSVQTGGATLGQISTAKPIGARVQLASSQATAFSVNYHAGSGDVQFELDGTGSVQLPTGTTAQRPTNLLAAGSLRYNTTTTKTEVYNGSAWANVGAVSGDITGLGLTASASRLIGRATASDGALEEIALDATLEFSGGNLGISDDAISAVKLATGAVGTDALATNAVTTVKVTDANITAAKLATDAKASTMLAVGTSTASVANTTIYASWDTTSSDALADSSNNIVVNDSDATQIDIGADGRYQIDCSFRMSGNNRIEAFCRTWLDTGSGFVRQSMHTASNYSSRDTDQNTGVVTLSTILSLSSGDKLKFQAEADADGTANMVLNGTLLRIIRHP